VLSTTHLGKLAARLCNQDAVPRFEALFPERILPRLAVDRHGRPRCRLAKDLVRTSFTRWRGANDNGTLDVKGVWRRIALTVILATWLLALILRDPLGLTKTEVRAVVGEGCGVDWGSLLVNDELRLNLNDALAGELVVNSDRLRYRVGGLNGSAIT
jgi:hypothetical protein